MAGSTRPQNRHLRQNRRLGKIGGHAVLQRVSLGFGLFGLIVPLVSEPGKRVGELLNIIADAISEYDTVPPGMMKKIRRTVSFSGVMLKNPEIDIFDVAVPLREADQLRNYFQWNSQSADWDIKHINFRNLKIRCNTVMLIVKEKTKIKPRVEEAA